MGNLPRGIEPLKIRVPSFRVRIALQLPPEGVRWFCGDVHAERRVQRTIGRPSGCPRGARSSRRTGKRTRGPHGELMPLHPELDKGVRSRRGLPDRQLKRRFRTSGRPIGKNLSVRFVRDHEWVPVLTNRTCDPDVRADSSTRRPAEGPADTHACSSPTRELPPAGPGAVDRDDVALLAEPPHRPPHGGLGRGDRGGELGDGEGPGRASVSTRLTVQSPPSFDERNLMLLSSPSHDDRLVSRVRRAFGGHRRGGDRALDTREESR
jgi:hypothetical protein